ncbi:hypothetical protein BHE74_00007968 [Ensete ventricosum]|nr:hypothetical protein GW17_00009460 [Ensete ventricosum]RWW83522.1 hypothetical protein BHE74_00007968 [Ensete ventricosum]
MAPTAQLLRTTQSTRSSCSSGSASARRHSSASSRTSPMACAGRRRQKTMWEIPMVEGPGVAPRKLTSTGSRESRAPSSGSGTS